MRNLLQSLEIKVRKTFKRQRRLIQQDRVDGVAELALDILRRNLKKAETEAETAERTKRENKNNAGTNVLYAGLPCPTQYLEEEARFAVQLRQVAARALDTKDLKALLNTMGSQVFTANDLRAELEKNADIAALVEDADDIELPAYVVKYRKMQLLKQKNEVKRELRKGQVSSKTKKGMPAGLRKLINRLAKLRRKECMKFRKSFGQFRSQVERYRKEHAAEDIFNRAEESIVSAIKEIQLFSKSKYLSELQNKVENLYAAKRAEYRKERLDLWNEMKKSAASPTDPSPLEAAQFAAITAESSPEELLSMEMRTRTWYAVKSENVAMTLRANDNESRSLEDGDDDTSILGNIAAGLDSIHDLLLGDKDNEMHKNSQIYKDDCEMAKHIFLRQERLELLERIRDARVAEEEFDLQRLSEKFKALETAEREAVANHLEKFGVVPKPMKAKAQSFGLPAGLDMRAINDAAHNDSGSKPEAEAVAEAGANPDDHEGDDDNSGASMLDPHLEFDFEKSKVTLQNMEEWFAQKLADVETVRKKKLDEMDASTEENEQEGGGNDVAAESKPKKSTAVEEDAKDEETTDPQDSSRATIELNMLYETENVIRNAGKSRLKPQIDLMEKLLVVLKAGHAYAERRIKYTIQRKKDAYKIDKERIIRERELALKIDKEALDAIEKDLENLQANQAKEVRLAEFAAEAKGREAINVEAIATEPSESDIGTASRKKTNGEEELSAFLGTVEALEWLLLHRIREEEDLFDCCAELKSSEGHFRGKRCVVASTIMTNAAMLGVLLCVIGRHGRVEEDLASFDGSLDLSEIDVTLSSEQDLAPLQGMTKLRRLDLTGCAITDAAVSSALASLWHIQTFIACSNALSDLGPFAKLHTLTDLDLSGNRSIVSIEPLRGLVAMKKICLSLCAIESLGPLQGMRDLRVLKAYDNDLSSGVQAGVHNDLMSLAMMPRLRDVNLHSNRIRDASPLSNLKFYPENSLHSLHLGNNALTNLKFLMTPVAACAELLGITPDAGGTAVVEHQEWNNLTSLILQHNHIQDLSAFAEACLPDLRRLDLSSQKPEPDGAASTSVKDFILDLSPLTARTVNMPALRVLDLADNRLRNVGKLGSANLPSLEELDLSHNQLVDVGGLAAGAADAGEDSDATGLKRLKVLNLEDNRLQDCPSLKYLVTLTELNICHNCLSRKSVVDVIGELRDLVELDLSENKSLKMDEAYVSWILEVHLPRLSEDSGEKLRELSGHRSTVGGMEVAAKCGCF